MASCCRVQYTPWGYIPDTNTGHRARRTGRPWDCYLGARPWGRLPRIGLDGMVHESFLRSATDVSPEVNELVALERLAPGLVKDDGHPDPGIAIALSGGGFRATLSALGVLRFLADADLLGRVQVASSVSGGSMANAKFARHWRELRDDGFNAKAFDELVLHPMMDRISRRSFQWTLYGNFWRTLGPKSFTDVLADKLDDWFYDRLALEELPGEDECRFIFNASDIRTGHRFAFRQQDMGEWADRYPSAGVRLAQAVAAFELNRDRHAAQRPRAPRQPRRQRQGQHGNDPQQRHAPRRPNHRGWNFFRHGAIRFSRKDAKLRRKIETTDEHGWTRMGLHRTLCVL